MKYKIYQVEFFGDTVELIKEMDDNIENVIKFCVSVQESESYEVTEDKEEVQKTVDLYSEEVCYHEREKQILRDIRENVSHYVNILDDECDTFFIVQ